MIPDPFKSLSGEQLNLLADALGDIRDSCVLISLALTDLLTDAQSTARDEVMIDVDRHLCRIREASRRTFD